MTRESKDRIGKWVGVVVGVFGLGFGGVVGAPKCSELETRAHAASTYVTREDAVTEHSQAHTERSLMHLQITELQRSNDMITTPLRSSLRSRTRRCASPSTAYGVSFVAKTVSSRPHGCGRVN